MTAMGYNQTRSRFTLIELLIVIAILGILASMLLPSLMKAKIRAKLTVEASNMKQVGLALHLYGDDFSGRLPGANDGRRRDHWTVRNRLIDYLDVSDPQIGGIWGCPIATVYKQGGLDNSWFWNAGWGSGLDEEGNSVGTPDNVDGYGGLNPDGVGGRPDWPEGFDIYIDGRGFDTPKEADEIVIVTDGLAEWWMVEGGQNTIPSGTNVPNHTYAGGSLTSTSLCLSGRVVLRTGTQLKYAHDGGAYGLF